MAVWTDDWAAGWVNVDSPTSFVIRSSSVGFPRSGTTLLDTMLMGLPTLSVLEERPMVARTLALLGDDALPTLTPDRIGELRAAYFEYAREYGWADDRWLVDKHPLNMARVPFIQRLFPKARFILAERHPYDVVLSCFMANFQLNVAMRSFTSLDEAAKTYDAVFSVWHRAQALLPVQSHAVRYERLVVDWLPSSLRWSNGLAKNGMTICSIISRPPARAAAYEPPATLRSVKSSTPMRAIAGVATVTIWRR